MVTFSAHLPPLVAGVLISHLTTHVMRTRPQTTNIDQWPTLAQQHADALAHLLNDGTGGVLTEVVPLRPVPPTSPPPRCSGLIGLWECPHASADASLVHKKLCHTP